MMNGIWIALVAASLIAAAFAGQMDAVTLASIDWAKKAVTIAIGLIGMMAFWLGMMRVARDAGLLRLLGRLLQPVMKRLFPRVPAEHPAHAAMIMNIAANMAGLTNAATPFGIKAMEELDRLNPKKGTATDAMCLFLAINTSNVALLPLGVIAIRASVGSVEPAGIFLTTWLATGFSTVVAIIAAKSLARMRRFRATDPGVVRLAAVEQDEALDTTGLDPESVAAQEQAAEVREGRSGLRRALVIAGVAAILAAMAAGVLWRLPANDAWGLADPVERPPSVASRVSALESRLEGLETGGGSAVERVAEASRELADKGLLELTGDVASAWILPVLMLIIALVGWARGVRVYESLVEGAKEGFQVAIRIIPYLVAILVAVGMFQASGALDLLIAWVSPVTSGLGLPAEALPMAVLRPLSGSGAFGVMTHALETYGPDGYIGYLVSTLQGSTETTLYVLAVYFGVVGIRRTRHALPACLIADAAGIVGAVLAVNLLTSL